MWSMSQGVAAQHFEDPEHGVGVAGVTGARRGPGTVDHQVTRFQLGRCPEAQGAQRVTMLCLNRN